MKRSISIKLQTHWQEKKKLSDLRNAYLLACNLIVPSVLQNRCWNRVALHNLVYSSIRKETMLGSQMIGLKKLQSRAKT